MGVATDPICSTRFFFASTAADIEMDEPNLSRPFLIAPHKPHPSVTLRDYFRALERFLLDENGKRLSAAFRLYRSAASVRDIREIRIRSEKHGTFYHIASIEIEVQDRTFKFATSTAATDRGKRCLNRELDVISQLNELCGTAYLPGIAAAAEIPFGGSTAVVMLSEWFQDHHEWHLHEDEQNGSQRILLWDQVKGDRCLSQTEALQVYRQCANILTSYFNFNDFRQIHPWRHAAGDFVVRALGGAVGVRLTTARDYQSVLDFGEGKKAAYTALVYFFLGLSVNMRLDRRNGVNDILWADAVFLPAVIEGFFEALRARSHAYLPILGPIGDLYSLTKDLSSEDLRRLLDALLEPYFGDDPDALEVIQDHMESHARELYAAVQRYRD